MDLNIFTQKISGLIQDGGTKEELFKYLSAEVAIGSIKPAEIRQYMKLIDELWFNREHIVENEINYEIIKVRFKNLLEQAKNNKDGFDFEDLFVNEEIKDYEKELRLYALETINSMLGVSIYYYQNRYYGEAAFKKLEVTIGETEKLSDIEYRKAQIFDSVIKVTSKNWLENYHKRYLADNPLEIDRIVWSDYQVNSLLEILDHINKYIKPDKLAEVRNLFYLFMENKINPAIRFIKQILCILAEEQMDTSFEIDTVYTKLIGGQKDKNLRKIMTDFAESIRAISLGAEMNKNKIWKPRGLSDGTKWADICVKYMSELYNDVLQNYFPFLIQNNLQIEKLIKAGNLVENWKDLLYIPKINFTLKDCAWDFIAADFMRVINKKRLYDGFYGGYFSLGQSVIAIHELGLFDMFFYGKKSSFPKMTMHHEVCHLVQYKYNVLQDWIAQNGIPDKHENLFKRALLGFSVHADSEDFNVLYNGRLVTCKEYFLSMVREAGDPLLVTNTDSPSYIKYCNSFQGHDPAFMFNLTKFGKIISEKGGVDTNECINAIKEKKFFFNANDTFAKKLYVNPDSIRDLSVPDCAPNQPPFPFNGTLGNEIPNY